jgi:uncharacterized membrane protein (DUF373 family)
MAEKKQLAAHFSRGMIVRGLSLVEDVVYVGLGILLSIAALVLLGAGFSSLFTAVAGHSLTGQFVALLDQTLQVLLVIELLYTVQVSFREHGLVAEPFLVVALIAVIRRILVVTAEAAHLPEAGDAVFRRTMVELVTLTVMMVVMVASLIAVQRQTARTNPGGATDADPGS